MAGTVYNDKEGQAEAMGRLAAALVSGSGFSEIEFENEKYIYLPYSKVTGKRGFIYPLRKTAGYGCMLLTGSS